MTLKRVFNFHEEKTHKLLRDECEEHDAHVYPKLRIADVLPIENSGISDEHYSFALKAHFDFVVSDSNHLPLFAVEFDGPTHESPDQVHRDLIKNALCQRFGFPLLRVNAKYLTSSFRNFDLLTWIIEVWFLADAFNNAQEQGLVPYDEPFDPISFVSLPGRRERFPMWLSVDLRLKIQRYSTSGRCIDPVPSQWIGKDENGNYRGVTWMRVTRDAGVWAASGMRSQQFPLVASELLGEILVFEIFARLEEVLNGSESPVPMSEIYARLKGYESKYSLCSLSAYSSPEDVSAT